MSAPRRVLATTAVIVLARRLGASRTAVAALLGLMTSLAAGCQSDDAPPPGPSPTSTLAVATHTAAPSSATPDPVPTATAVSTSTLPASPTAERTPRATETEVPESTPTAEPTPTGESTPTTEGTPTPQSTPTADETSNTPTETSTANPTASPTDGPPAMTAEVVDEQVRLQWTNIGRPSGYTHARVVRRLNLPPSGPDDPESAAIFTGEGSEVFDPMIGLLPDTATGGGRPAVQREYFYTVYPCTPEGLCLEDGVTTQLRPTLVQVLRAGGYVIHWRHAAADVCSDQLSLGTAATTSVPDWWRSCNAMCSSATARQMNAAGVAEALEIGDVFRQRDIPVARVLSSEFCRNFRTAELMDLGPPVELSQAITFYVYVETHRCANSFTLIGELPAAGGNTALIGHGGFPSACPPLDGLAWSEAAIFKPDGSGGAELIVRLFWSEWRSLP